MILETAAERRELMDRSRTVAMVGASPNPTRPSYFVFSYLRTRGKFEVTPINPATTEIDGVKSYPSLAAYAAENGPPDIVDVFRKADDAPQVAREAIAAGAKAIWFQYGVINDEAIRLADEAGLAVVVDRCIKVESARFDGGLSLSGMNTGVLTARRRVR
ncbi:MAG: CoA-binding protein [Candidatus Eremiobacteraeota bacterium]|nr:CoA-binding protein [Candidatus Eremiobacteraeota bacterium]